MYLTNDREAIRRRTGFDPFEHSLPPKLAIDGYRSAMPLMAAEEDRKPLVFVKEIDRTNIELLNEDRVKFVWYGPYFSFGGLRGPSDAHPDLATAVSSEIVGQSVLDPRMPVDLYRSLEEALGGRAGDGGFTPPHMHYVIARRDVSAAFVPGRTELKAAARPFIADLDTDRLEPWLEREPEDRFRALDAMMDEADLGGLLVASPLSIQDLTGIPMRAVGEEAWAFYPRGGQVVHLLCRRELPWIDLPLAAKADARTIQELVEGARIGVEEVALSEEALEGFGLAEATPATSLLRRWRERRSWEDAAAYVIGARVTLEAIREALAFVERGFSAGDRVTEMNAYERYRSKVGLMIRAYDLPIRVRTYFTHTHAGDRSHFPASATDHDIPPSSSLKIDGGLEIYDSHGMFLGVSDITRSATGSEAARAFYDLLDRALCEGAIAACRPGTKGSDVFSSGLSWLEPHRAAIVEGGFMPPSEVPLSDLFRRNIGHLIGKQEPATVEFARDDQMPVEAGMVAAAEFQWPYASYTIGAEDVFLITEDEPINLTRPT